METTLAELQRNFERRSSSWRLSGGACGGHSGAAALIARGSDGAARRWPRPTKSIFRNMCPSFRTCKLRSLTLFDFDVNGVVSGIGYLQNHAVVGDCYNRLDVSNAEATSSRKADGGDSILSRRWEVIVCSPLGTPYVNWSKAAKPDSMGPAGIGYSSRLRQPTASRPMAGNLPTPAIGAEYTFTFENINIERGLLWNQENAINRGLQLNYTYGPLACIGKLEQWLLLSQLHLGYRFVGVDDKSRKIL